MTHDRVETETGENGGTTRRAMLSAAAGGFVVGASGLFLPDWLEEAEAREGAYGGKLGGRHGKNRRGLNHAKRRKRARRRDNRRDDDKGAPGSGSGFYRNVAIAFRNETSEARSFEFWRDEHPWGISDWRRERGPETLQPGGSSGIYKSPTEGAAAWIAGQYWVSVLNPPAGLPSVTLVIEGQVQDGSGHSGGHSLFPPSDSLSEEDSASWILGANSLTVFRDKDTKDYIPFIIRLHPR